MKVVFFSKGDFSVASSRYRCFYFARALEENGINTKICLPPPRHFGIRNFPSDGIKELFRLVKELLNVNESDIIYTQRTIYNTLFVILLILYKFLFRRIMIFDFDDAIFIHSPWKTKALTMISDMVIVGSHYLKEYAEKYNENVHLIPTSIDLELFDEPTNNMKVENKIVIGWVGDAKAHKENLLMLIDLFKEVEEKEQFILRLIGTKNAPEVESKLNNLHINSECIKWIKPENIPKEISKFDIGVMPLQMTEWNKGKCALKLLEYMSLQIPVIASAVGENKYVIEDGKNGFLAFDKTDWIRKIRLVIKDANLRETIGKNARKTVEERYSLRVMGTKLANLLQELK